MSFDSPFIESGEATVVRPTPSLDIWTESHEAVPADRLISSEEDVVVPASP